MDPLLGPEMRSTGEVMGLDEDFGLAFAKSQLAAGQVLPLAGGVLFSVKDPDKAATVPLARGFQEEGFKLFATAGTAAYLEKHGLAVTRVHKIREGRPNIIDHIKSQEIHLLINTPEGRYTPGGLLLHPPGRPGIQHPLHHHRGRGQGHPGLHPGHETGQTGSEEFAGVS